MISKDKRLDIIKKASLCRHFENKAYENIGTNITFPAYLSAGQELIAASISTELEVHGIEPQIFIQHRGHSTYLSFGGAPEKLIDELLGRPTGCAYGMGGSASIHCPEKSIYGHDGLMGSHVPIAVGACYANSRPTIVFVGDAAAEEDYAMGAYGWASTKELPILFVVEDNNLSILTEKCVRRNWQMHDLANALCFEGYDIPDDPNAICPLVSRWCSTMKPMLLNINTHRLYWHSGAGCDDPNIFDRYKEQLGLLGDEGKSIDLKIKQKVEELWARQLQQ